MIRRVSLSAAAAALSLATSAVAADLAEGQRLYDRHCAGCHGADGRPVLPGTPDFTRGEGLFRTDPELVNAIRHGVRTMPGFEGQIEMRGFLDVVVYLRTLQR